jgi:hypothetical protein
MVHSGDALGGVIVTWKAFHQELIIVQKLKEPPMTNNEQALICYSKQ